MHRDLLMWWEGCWGLFFFFFGCATRRIGSQFPDQGSNLYPLHWKLGVLTTGLPEKSRVLGSESG